MIKLSLHAYVSFLLQRFNEQDGETSEVTLFNNLSHRWFGLLPFLLKCIVSDTKK